MLTVGEIIQGKAVDLDYQGQGVVRYDGYVVFVKGLIDGEEAKIRIIKIHKQFGFGAIEEIIISSHDRITPISDLESCDLSHLTLEKQRAWQVKITKETLKKIANLDVEIEEILYDQNDQNYRNKTVFHVMENTFLTLGLFNRNNDKLVPVSSFDLADKPTNQMLEHLEKHKLLTDPTILKHIVFRTNPTQEMLVTLVAHAKMFVGLRELVLFFGKQSNVKGVTLNIIDNPKSILGRKSVVLYGENVLIEPLKTISVFINDRSFFQVNSPVIEKAYQVIKEEINVGDTVIDAYSGVGSIGFYLSDKAEKITMVEINPNSIDMANKTKDRYQFSHINIIEERAEKMLHVLSADHLIVDPPRSGLSEELMDAILVNSFQKIFYLSCDVKTLARDLKRLLSSYEIKRVIPIKMFYHTSSLETLIVLIKI